MPELNRIHRSRKHLAALAAVLVLGGCRAHERAPAQSARPAEAIASRTTSRPTQTGPVLWENIAKGVRLNYPANWRRKSDPDYELTLIPPGAPTDDRRITLDIPDLPPHLPWMIQMSRIQHDYLQDLKKQHPNLRLLDASPIRVPNASARLVRSAWGRGAGQYDDLALMIIHASAVYILDARTNDSRLSDTRRVFDRIKASLQWR